MPRAVAPQLGEGGLIGFVLSTWVYEPIPGLAVSNAPRPALAGYAKTLAGELGPRACVAQRRTSLVTSACHNEWNRARPSP